jgi:hypothetical protein
MNDVQNASSREPSSWFVPSEKFVETKVAWKRALKKSVILAIVMAEKAVTGSKMEPPNFIKAMRAKLHDSKEINLKRTHIGQRRVHSKKSNAPIAVLRAGDLQAGGWGSSVRRGYEL